MRGWNLEAALSYIAGVLAASLWPIAPPSPDPWVRIPIALVAAVLLAPFYAWLFRQKRP